MTFEELRLEEITARLNRFKRADEKPFAAVNAVSEFNQRAYELFGRPVVKAVANEYGAKLSRALSSAARAAVVLLRSQSCALVARAGRERGEGAPAGHFARIIRCAASNRSCPN